MNFRITLTVLIAICVLHSSSNSVSASKFLLDEGANISSKYARKFFSTSPKNMNTTPSKKPEIKDQEKKIPQNFSGSIPQKKYDKKDLIEYDLISRVSRYTSPFSKESGLIKFPESSNIQEKDYDFAVLKTPSILHKANILSGLNTFYDRRKLIEQPYEYPWYLNGYLLSRFKGNLGFRGTGILIGEKHALTAAHCVRYNNEISHDIEFLLGATPKNVLKKTVVNKVFVHDDLDLAILELNLAVGSELGWSALREVSPEEIYKTNFLATIAGYAAQKNFISYYWKQERDMFAMDGPIVKIDGDHINYLIDTSKGQSGAGIWKKLDDGRVENYGIHTTGTGDPISGNFGVRINSKTLDFIGKHIY